MFSFIFAITPFLRCIYFFLPFDTLLLFHFHCFHYFILLPLFSLFAIILYFIFDIFFDYFAIIY